MRIPENTIFSFILLSTFIMTLLQSQPTIVITLDQVPAREQESIAHSMLPHLSSVPTEIIHKAVNHLFTGYQSGILALYGGYRSVSDNNGRIILPLLHAITPQELPSKQKLIQKIYLAITPSIKPIFALGSTISHLEYLPEEEASLRLYQCDLMQDEQHSYYWNITLLPRPESPIINNFTVVMLTNSENISMPLGHYYTPNYTGHLILPHAQAFHTIPSDTLWLEKNWPLLHFFEQVKSERKEEAQETITLINNI